MKEYEVFIRLKNVNFPISFGVFTNHFEAQRELTKRKKTNGFIDGWIEELGSDNFYNKEMVRNEERG